VLNAVMPNCPRLPYCSTLNRTAVTMKAIGFSPTGKCESLLFSTVFFLTSKNPSSTLKMTGFSIPDASESQDSPHKYDIEHVPVENDPRKWTPFRKVRRLLDLHYLQYRS
jgi:hypothetical protein